jgi:ribosome recycling factor
MSWNKDKLEKELDQVLESFQDYLRSLRTGRPSILLFENIPVEYYGTMASLKSAANIVIETNQSVLIIPFVRNDKAVTDKIVAGIQNAQLGYSPVNEGNQIRINIPPLTQEKRELIVDQMHDEKENRFKRQVRQIRQDAMQKADAMEGVSEDVISTAKKEIQKLIDATIAEIDSLAKAREEEIKDISS